MSRAWPLLGSSSTPAAARGSVAESPTHALLLRPQVIDVPLWLMAANRRWLLGALAEAADDDEDGDEYIAGHQHEYLEEWAENGAISEGEVKELVTERCRTLRQLAQPALPQHPAPSAPAQPAAGPPSGASSFDLTAERGVQTRGRCASARGVRLGVWCTEAR